MWISFSIFSGPWKKRYELGPGSSFPANPDLVDVVGDMDFIFDIFHSLYLFGFQISGFPGSQISRNLAWAGLGPGWAGLGPGWAGLVG